MIENYVAIDLEMTGLNAKTDRILEVAAIRVREGKEVAVFSEIVNPQVKLNEKVIELTGITQEEADAGRDLDETLYAFLEFLGEDILVGQNIIFDYSFLKQWAVNHKLPLEKTAIDTLKLARQFLPAEQKKDLASLCEYYKIQRLNAHRALDDTRETVEVLQRLARDYEAGNPSAFEPKPLQYKAKKQSPMTLQQKRYLDRFAAYHNIEIPELENVMTKSEASRLMDKLISQYGKVVI